MKTIFQINRTMTILAVMIVTMWWWLIIITSIRLPRLSSILPYTSFLEWYCPEFFYNFFFIFLFVKCPQTLFENAVSMQIDDYDDEKYHREPPHTGWIGHQPEKIGQKCFVLAFWIYNFSLNNELLCLFVFALFICCASLFVCCTGCIECPALHLTDDKKHCKM